MFRRAVVRSTRGPGRPATGGPAAAGALTAFAVPDRSGRRGRTDREIFWWPARRRGVTPAGRPASSTAGGSGCRRRFPRRFPGRFPGRLRMYSRRPRSAGPNARVSVRQRRRPPGQPAVGNRQPGTKDPKGQVCRLYG